MKILKTLVGCGVLALSCCLCNAVTAAPQVGWYWNPAESGRGFFIESHNGITFLGIYFYDATGHASWLVAGGQNADAYNYSGQLYSLTRGQTLLGSYAAPVGPNYSGTVSMHFTDDTHGTLTWPGGTTAIERQIFGGTGAAFQPTSGWWWNPAESGSGYSIELQGNQLFIVGFMYDDSGQPVWYYSAGPMQSGTTYSGPVLKFSNGQIVGGPYHPPGAPETVATLDIAFSGADQATLTLSETSTASGTQAKVGARRQTQIQTEFTQAPKGFAGRFSVDANLHSAISGITVDEHMNLSFEKLVLTPGLFPFDTEYDVTSGTITATFRQMQTVPGSTCVGTGSGSDAIQNVILSAWKPGIIMLPDESHYSLHLVMDASVGATIDYSWTCTSDDGTSTTTSLSAPIIFDTGVDTGTFDGRRIAGAGNATPDIPGGSLVVTYDYDFAATH